MAFIRKKTVEMDGVSVPVSPLLSREVDEFLSNQLEVLKNTEKPAAERFEAMKTLWLGFIVAGLNQAGAEPKFTIERLHAEFDKVFLEKLRAEIMQMSGIGVVGEVKAP